MEDSSRWNKGYTLVLLLNALYVLLFYIIMKTFG